MKKLAQDIVIASAIALARKHEEESTAMSDETMTDIDKLAADIAEAARKYCIGGDAWPPLLDHAIKLALAAGEQRGVKLQRERDAEIAASFKDDRKWGEFIAAAIRSAQ